MMKSIVVPEPRRKSHCIGFVLAVAVAFCAPAFAAVCNGSATSLATYGSAGCSVGNLLFSNISVGTTTNTIVGPANTIAPGSNTVVLPDGTTILVSASGGGLDFSTGASLPPCTTGRFCVNGKNQSLTATITFEVSTLDNSNSITQASLLASLHSHVNGANADVFSEICPGAVAFTQGCAGYQVGELGGGGHNLSLNNGSTTLFFTATNTVWIRDTIYLTTNNGTASDAAVTDLGFGAGVSPTPEPATEGLVGLALLTLGAVKFGKARKS